MVTDGRQRAFEALADESRRTTRRIYRLQASGSTAVQEYLQTVWGRAGARFRLLTAKIAPSGE